MRASVVLLFVIATGVCAQTRQEPGSVFDQIEEIRIRSERERINRERTEKARHLANLYEVDRALEKFVTEWNIWIKATPNANVVSLKHRKDWQSVKKRFHDLEKKLNCIGYK